MMKRSRNAGWMNSATRIAMMVMLCGAGAVGLEGCGKKKPTPKPAPPAQAPAAPEKAPVSFDSISQDMKADPRVQFAPGLDLEEEDLARSLIELSDALAKGDSAALSRLTTRSTRTVVEKIDEMGGFGAEGEAEAVRVVFIGKNDESAGFKLTLDDVNKMFSGEQASVDEVNKKLTPDVARQIGVLMGAALAADGGFDASVFAPPMTAEKLAKLRESWEKLRADSSKSAVVEEIASLLASSSAVPGLKDAEYMALIAVQTPDGVELTGWGIEKAFGKWTFSSASTDGQVKKSAAEWDGIGLAGFSRDSRTGIEIAAAKTEGDSDDSTGDEKKTDEKTDEEKKDEPAEQQKPPGEKNTPGGPVKLPGGG